MEKQTLYERDEQSYDTMHIRHVIKQSQRKLQINLSLNEENLLLLQVAEKALRDS